MGVIFWIKINMSPTFVRFRPWEVGLESSFHQDRQPMILSPLDEVMTVIRNLVKSSKFSEFIICPVAPIFCENIAKIALIEGKKTDLGILQFLRLSGLGRSTRGAVGSFTLRTF